jgi:hypothetical protein
MVMGAGFMILRYSLIIDLAARYRLPSISSDIILPRTVA